MCALKCCCIYKEKKKTTRQKGDDGREGEAVRNQLSPTPRRVSCACDAVLSDLLVREVDTQLLEAIHTENLNGRRKGGAHTVTM